MDRAHLRHCALFADMPPDLVVGLVAAGSKRIFRRGARLFRQGDRLAHLFLVTAGHVKLTQVGDHGKEVIMRLVGPGQAIAALAAFDRARVFPVGATALTEVEAVVWDRDSARRLAADHPQFAAALTREISSHAQELQQRLREQSTERVPQRLAHLLLRLVEQVGVPERDGTRIGIPLTRQDLAEMTGTTLYTVSRLLSEWSEKGILEIGRARVVVRSLRGLVDLARRES